MRTSNLVTFNPSKDLPLAYDSTTGDIDTSSPERALGTKAPGASGGPPINDPAYAHGEIPESNVAALLLKTSDDSSVDISVYVFNKTWGEWVKAGAGAADYVKTIESRGQWAFTGQEGTLFYLVASTVKVTRATLHAARIRS